MIRIHIKGNMKDKFVFKTQTKHLRQIGDVVLEGIEFKCGTKNRIRSFLSTLFLHCD